MLLAVLCTVSDVVFGLSRICGSILYTVSSKQPYKKNLQARDPEIAEASPLCEQDTSVDARL